MKRLAEWRKKFGLSQTELGKHARGVYGHPGDVSAMERWGESVAIDFSRKFNVPLHELYSHRFIEEFLESCKNSGVTLDSLLSGCHSEAVTSRQRIPAQEHGMIQFGGSFRISISPDGRIEFYVTPNPIAPCPTPIEQREPENSVTPEPDPKRSGTTEKPKVTRGRKSKSNLDKLAEDLKTAPLDLDGVNLDEITEANLRDVATRIAKKSSGKRVVEILKEVAGVEKIANCDPNAYGRVLEALNRELT